MAEEITISGGFHLSIGIKKKSRKRKPQKRRGSRRSWRRAGGRFKKSFMDEVNRIAPEAGVRLCRHLYRQVSRALKWTLRAVGLCFVSWVVLAFGLPPELMP